MAAKAAVLNIDKPTGLTSFDVVARVRRATGIKRVGHAGTLDPLASGVLLVCLGYATRIISYLQDAPKVYLAGIRIGVRTTTYDAEGDVVEQTTVPDTLDLAPFIGDILQTPPMYSALKRQGRPLYEYARKGQTLEIEPRPVRIDNIELVTWRPPDAIIRVHCGKGTYIRSLANDLGGHLTSLVREAVGDFCLADAMPLDQLPTWENYAMPLAAALPRLPRLAVDALAAQRLRNGLGIQAPAGETVALDEEDQPVAILNDGHPRIVFPA